MQLTFSQSLGVDAVQPELKMPEQFVLSVHRALRLDALESSHPISVEVNNPAEISSIFDSITYSKGAAVIQMMANFLGMGTFLAGLTNYFNDLKYKAATQDDLWRFLTEQARRDGSLPADLDVKTVMDSWTLQTGYPVVTVVRDYSTGTANVTQTRQDENDFFVSPTEQKQYLLIDFSHWPERRQRVTPSGGFP